MDGAYILDRNVHGIRGIVVVHRFDLSQRLDESPMNVLGHILGKKGH